MTHILLILFQEINLPYLTHNSGGHCHLKVYIYNVENSVISSSISSLSQSTASLVKLPADVFQQHKAGRLSCKIMESSVSCVCYLCIRFDPDAAHIFFFIHSFLSLSLSLNAVVMIVTWSVLLNGIKTPNLPCNQFKLLNCIFFFFNL